MNTPVRDDPDNTDNKASRLSPNDTGEEDDFVRLVSPFAGKKQRQQGNNS